MCDDGTPRGGSASAVFSRPLSFFVFVFFIFYFRGRVILWCGGLTAPEIDQAGHLIKCRGFLPQSHAILESNELSVMAKAWNGEIGNCTARGRERNPGEEGRGVLMSCHYSAVPERVIPRKGGRVMPLQCGSGEGSGQGCTVLDLMHGRSRMAINPRTPTMPGRSTSGIRPPGRQQCSLASSARRGGVFGESHEG